jgi:putative DNA methylase
MGQHNRKLIEVALPLEAINRASAREKSIRHGHPSTLHLWWARRPLATCRAVLFASVVDDPSAHPDEFPTTEAQETERQRLFTIIEELVKWENSTSETVLSAARAEIVRSCDGDVPSALDPFCGGGSIPLEAQRLGLEAKASDLNPVAVLITKALVEIPPKFAGLPPVNPSPQGTLDDVAWRGTKGLADDVRYYGQWMLEEAERRIGHLYPKANVPTEQGGGEATVIAWLWARTVKCPNPACGAEMPLVRSFNLASKKGKQAWIEPVVGEKSVGFEVKTGTGVAPEGTVNRQGARCIVCGGSVEFDHIRIEGRAGRMGVAPLAIAAEGNRCRLYLKPDDEQTRIAREARPSWKPETDLPEHALGFRVQVYGMTKYSDLYTNRQLVALTTFSDLVAEARGQVLRDAESVWPSLSVTLPDEATPSSYADAVSTYLAFAVDRMANYGSTICTWHSGIKYETITSTFARQTLQMTWDYAESNPFSGASGDWVGGVTWIANAIEQLPASAPGVAVQLDAVAQSAGPATVVSTDPPYYDNIGYADLSDYFYVWLRPALRECYPDLFSTLQTPKTQELIATPFRFGGDKAKARAFFENGLGQVFRNLRAQGDSEYPVSIYYAFKQAEGSAGGSSPDLASTGWETMLSGLLNAGFSICGTWPMRTELTTNLKKTVGALASSIVLVCRPRSATAPLATRKEFIGALRAELPDALQKLQHGNIAPVDLAQASIGPGMSVFSRYSRVMEADGTQMSVRAALALINQALDEILAEQEGEFDADTRWAIAWFEQFGTETGDFGFAETLCKAKNSSVRGLVEAGIVEAKTGKVRLLRRDELDEMWDPSTDQRLTVWEMTQHLLRRLDEGETAAAALAHQLGSYAGVARDLAYRLYLACERKKWSQEGQAYNSLVIAWPHVQRLAAAEPSSAGPSQTSFEV